MISDSLLPADVDAGGRRDEAAGGVRAAHEPSAAFESAMDQGSGGRIPSGPQSAGDGIRRGDRLRVSRRGHRPHSALR